QNQGSNRFRPSVGDADAATIFRNSRGWLCQDCIAKHRKILYTFIPVQFGKHLLDGADRVTRDKRQIYVLGLKDVAYGSHTLLPLHLSFWRRTSGNERSGSMTSASLRSLLAMRRTSPTRMARHKRPSTDTNTSCSGTERRASMMERSLTTVERLVRTWGQIGVTTNAPESGMRMGPPAASEYAVEPVGVAMIRPSAL